MWNWISRACMPGLPAHTLSLCVHYNLYVLVPLIFDRKQEVRSTYNPSVQHCGKKSQTSERSMPLVTKALVRSPKRTIMTGRVQPPQMAATMATPINSRSWQLEKRNWNKKIQLSFFIWIKVAGGCCGGLHSTDVAILLLTQRLQVRFSALPKIDFDVKSFIDGAG